MKSISSYPTLNIEVLDPLRAPVKGVEVGWGAGRKGVRGVVVVGVWRVNGVDVA